MSDVLKVGKKLVELCNANKNIEAVETLYAPNVVCVEPMSMPGMPARTEGFDAIKKKNVDWMANHDIHLQQVTGPWPNGDRFAVHMKIDVTAKSGPMAGKRMKMEEVGLYTVKNGKITQEEFFYDMGG